MLDTWKVDVNDDMDAAVIARATDLGRELHALGDPQSGEVTCFLYVDVDYTPVVVTKDEITTW